MRVFLDLMWFFKQERKSSLSGIALLVIIAILELLLSKIIEMVVDYIANTA